MEVKNFTVVIIYKIQQQKLTHACTFSAALKSYHTQHWHLLSLQKNDRQTNIHIITSNLALMEPLSCLAKGYSE